MPSWLPYFEGSGIPAPQEKKLSSPLDFRTWHARSPTNTNAANSTGEAVDVLSQPEGGLDEQGDRSQLLEQKRPAPSSLSVKEKSFS